LSALFINACEHVSEVAGCSSFTFTVTVTTPSSFFQSKAVLVNWRVD